MLSGALAIAVFAALAFLILCFAIAATVLGAQKRSKRRRSGGRSRRQWVDLMNRDEDKQD